MRSTLMCIAVFVLSPAMVLAQSDSMNGDPAIDMARTLDRKLDKLMISSRELPAALAEIGERVGVAIIVEDRSLALLPWGRRTKLADVTIENASLREVLPKILGPLGMTYVLQDEGVLVKATEPLKRINRRATWNDLKLLQRCHQTPYTPENLEKFDMQYRITKKVNAPEQLKRQLERAGRGSVAEMLEVATGSLGWVWFPNEDHIVIRTMQAQIANKLSRRITIRYENVPLAQILLELSDRAEVALLLEPGLMLKLPPAARSPSLVIQQSSIRQALNILSAETGIKYEMQRDGLFIGLADDYPVAARPPAVRRSPYVGKISVLSGDKSCTYDFLLREDELPEDILQYRREVIKAYVEKMRKDMASGETLEPSGIGP